MIDASVEREIINELANLPAQQQAQVLEYARSLGRRRTVGTTGKSLLRFGGMIEPDELAAMVQAIEEGCEQVQLDEW